MTRARGRRPGRTYSNHPLSDACRGCEKDLGGTTPLFKDRNGNWWHKDCWEAEHE